DARPPDHDACHAEQREQEATQAVDELPCWTAEKVVVQVDQPQNERDLAVGGAKIFAGIRIEQSRLPYASSSQKYFGGAILTSRHRDPRDLEPRERLLRCGSQLVLCQTRSRLEHDCLRPEQRVETTPEHERAACDAGHQNVKTD